MGTKFATGAIKVLGALFGLFLTVVGGIWTGYEVLDLRMDHKVMEGKKEVLSIMAVLKDERNAKIQAVDDKITERSRSLEGKIDAVNGKVDILLRLATSSRKRDVSQDNEKLTLKSQRDSLSGSL